MNQETLAELQRFRDNLRSLRHEIRKKSGVMIHQKHLQESARTLVTLWVEKLHSPLEHKFKLPVEDITNMAEQMKTLYRLSLASNRKTSYMKALNSSLRKFNDRFMVPVMQFSPNTSTVFDIRSMFPNLSDPNASEYMNEAIGCANSDYLRAAFVLGWCAVIDRMQSYFIRKEFDYFNQLCMKLNEKKSGKFKNWNKKFNINTISELQAIFDSDLITLIEGDSLIDSNQATNLRRCLDNRNQSAHPGEFSLTKDHLKMFFSDIRHIIFENPKLNQ